MSPNKNKDTTYNLRARCAKTIFDIIEQGNSLNTVLSNYTTGVNDKDRALMQEICFGVLRTLPELEFYVQKLMDKVFVNKNRPIHYLLLIGIYQIIYTRIPPHAAASETVNGTIALKKPQLKGVVNGVLRSFLRKQVELKADFVLHGNTSLHPNWLLKRIQNAYPDNWQTIIDANNQRPPMWIRVNKLQYTTEKYQEKLNESDIQFEQDNQLTHAIRLIKPIQAHHLPYFEQGAATIQDLSAQQAAYLLNPQNGELILDLCAAPGGKTTHILELAPRANVIAVDIDPLRLKRIDENLKRLKLTAEVKVGDGLTPEKWCDNIQFDRILLDAPCSATGVIRRHPDIKWLRRNSDIEELSTLQYQILTTIWAYLKQGGTILYATCSILPQENTEQITRFLKHHNDAILIDEMKQYFPDAYQGDGFFYAALQKG